MKVAVIANGEWDSSWGQDKLKTNKYDLLVSADGGANLAISSGVLPDVLIGDLDSIDADNLRICRENNTKVIKYPAVKDQTDLELAIEYAENYLTLYGKPEDEIQLFAAGGKRLDHLFGNIAIMLGAVQRKRKVIMIDRDASAWVMLPSKVLISGREGQQISIISLSEKAEVYSRGLYYELDHLTLCQNSARGISNVFIQNEIELEVLQGAVLLVLNN